VPVLAPKPNGPIHALPKHMSLNRYENLRHYLHISKPGSTQQPPKPQEPCTEAQQPRQPPKPCLKDSEDEAEAEVEV
jgi:hypothetical protein